MVLGILAAGTDLDLVTWVIIPFFIFFARICDVTIGTIRYIMITRGFKYIAPVFGFFEVIIWLLAIGQVMENITNVFCYLAYGGGYAMGTFFGMVIEERLKLGMAIIRIISGRPAEKLVERLRNDGFGVTSIRGEGGTGVVAVIFMVVKRSKIPRVIGIIREHNPSAFYTIEDVRNVSEGIFPGDDENNPFRMFRRPFIFIGKRK